MKHSALAGTRDLAECDFSVVAPAEAGVDSRVVLHVTKCRLPRMKAAQSGVTEIVTNNTGEVLMAALHRFDIGI
ncbi:hypothetical protein [Acetobacter fallax]|uniref:Uncharacterized protein n=1 Tax=Acetobacter fallax TaxID=1737473 RepID=A0ABX0KDT3_9PROT|nr:hypothetical protein [Acetobacter fallax]NHO33968.1 hypothetical protein [Acetobacter fallax]NHO37503.1 hypothetical protein [Acetobacter fallax]